MSDPKPSAIEILAKAHGLSPATVTNLFRATGQPAPAVAPSYEGVTLGSLMPSAAPTPIGPPAPEAGPTPSYEGATLQGLGAAPSGQKFSVSSMDSGASSKPRAVDPRIAVMTGDNTDTTATGNASNVVLPEDMTSHTGGGDASVPGAALPQQAPLTPGVAVPAHWQPGTHEVTQHHGFEPGAFEPANYDRDVSAGHAMLGADSALQAATLRGQADSAYGAAKAAGDAHFARMDQEREQRRKNFVVGETQKLEQLNTEAQKKVDPKAYWKEAGTMGSVLTGLMIGLGQFASMWKGGSNAALQIVTDNINSNIDAQKSNIANARGAFNDRMSLYQRNLDAFGDEERATLATKMQYLDQVAAMAGQIKTQAGQLDAEAAKSNILAGIYKDKAEYETRFAELTGTRSTERMNEQFMPRQVLGGGAGAMKREGNLVTLEDGTTYRMPSEKVAEKAIEKISTLGEMADRANRIVKLRGETAQLGVTDIEKRAINTLELKKLTRELEALESVAEGQGVITKEDHAQNKELGLSGDSDMGAISGVNPFADSNRKATNSAYQSMVQRWKQDAHNYAQSAGGAVYDKNYTRGPGGVLTPSGSFTGQDAKPRERMAPAGSTPISKTTGVPTAGASDRKTTPFAPVVAAPVGVPTVAAPKKSRKKR